jgi:hypothetical protein
MNADLNAFISLLDGTVEVDETYIMESVSEGN